MKGSILGSEPFIKEIHKEYANRPICDEIPQQRLLLQQVSHSMDDILHAVADYFNIEKVEVTSTKFKKGGCLAKDIAIYLALQLPGQKIRILKKYFNNSNQSISQIYNRAKGRAKTDEIFLNHIRNIKEKLR